MIKALLKKNKEVIIAMLKKNIQSKIAYIWKKKKGKKEGGGGGGVQWPPTWVNKLKLVYLIF